MMLMEYVFLFWVLLIGILIAMVQDLKRREVDNWLNFLIMIFGIVFWVFAVVAGGAEVGLLLQVGFLFVMGFVLMNLFYYGHVFAGGDAKLLWAMSVFFVGASFFESGLNFLIFCFFLFFCGGIYGMIYSFVLYSMNFKRSNVRIKKQLARLKFAWFLALGIIVFVLGFWNSLLFSIGVLLVLFPLLLAFAKGLEDVVMIKNIRGRDLRLGDWLAHDVKVGSKVVRATFDGVSLKEMRLLKKKDRVTIKEGIPFVPSFLFGFLFYLFYSGKVIEMFNLTFLS
jgi:hypothetical protein